MSLSAEVDVALYRRLAAAQGKRLIETSSSVWIETRKYYFESLPGHRKIQLEPGEARRLFLGGAGIVRYTCEIAEGSPAYEIVCEDKNYGFDSLASDARRRVRRGLANCSTGPLAFDVLAREGCEINRSVLERQGRNTRSFFTDEAQWRSYVGFMSTLPNVRALGTHVDGKLCAFVLAGVVDGYCYLLHTHSHTDFLKYSPMNALIFTVTREMLAVPGVHCVSQGLESLVARPDLEHFKLAMGYRRHPIGRKILVHPMWRPLFFRPILRLIEPFAGRRASQKVRELISISDSLEGRPEGCAS